MTVNGVVAHEDWLPTFASAAGKTDIKQDLLDGYEALGRTYKNHIDGYDMLEYLSNADSYKSPTESYQASPRKEFWYFNDDGEVVAIRLSDWKSVFLENRGETFQLWREPFVKLRLPLLFNLRRDSFEKAQHNSNTYNDWALDRPYVIVPMQQMAAKFAKTFIEFPPSQKPGSFNLDGIVEKLKESGGSN